MKNNLKICIIGAMECEINQFKSLLNDVIEQNISNFKIISGRINDNLIHVCQSGVGKAASAMTTQFLIDKFNPDLIVNTGVAGGINKNLNVGDIVVGNSFFQYDFNTIALGYALGYMCNGIEPNKPTKFSADEKLVQLFLNNISKTDFNIMSGIIASGDTFISSSQQKDEIRKVFNADAVDMESASIAQVCNFNNVPFLIIRAISDLADGSAPVSLNEVEEKMAHFASAMTLKLIEKLN